MILNFLTIAHLLHIGFHTFYLLSLANMSMNTHFTDLWHVSGIILLFPAGNTSVHGGITHLKVKTNEIINVHPHNKTANTVALYNFMIHYRLNCSFDTGLILCVTVSHLFRCQSQRRLPPCFPPRCNTAHEWAGLSPQQPQRCDRSWRGGQEGFRDSD